MSDRHDSYLNSSIPTSSRSRRSSTTRSIRSTSSTTYNRQPTWKTSPLKGPAPAAASLSMVFAEPELGSPLSSAATTAAAISTSSSTGTSLDRTKLTDNIKEVIEEEGGSEDVGTPRDQLEIYDSSHIDNGQHSTSGSVSPITFPSFPPSNDSVTTQNSPTPSPSLRPKIRKDSWYSTLTRSKGKTAIHTSPHASSSKFVDEANSPLPESLPILPPPPLFEPPAHVPTLKVEAPTPRVEHSSVFDALPSPSTIAAIPIEILSPIPTKQTTPMSISGIGINFGSPQRQDSSSQSPGKRSWFASPPTPTPSPPKLIPSTPPPSYPIKISESSTPILSQSPTETRTPQQEILAQQAASSAVAADYSSQSSTTVSSVDDSVPSLPHTPPVNARSTSATKSPPLSHSVALNPSSSRFTLSLPLLGRTKIPLPLSVGMGGETLILEPAPQKEEVLSAANMSEERQSRSGQATTATTPNESEPADAGVERSSKRVELVGLSAEPDKTSPFVVRSISPSPSQPTTTAGPSPTTSKPSETGINSSSSWWDYVGWTSGSARPSDSAGRAGSSKVMGTGQGDEGRDSVEGAEAIEKEHREALAVVEAVIETPAPAGAEVAATEVPASQPNSEVVEGTADVLTSSNSSTDNVTSAWLSPWLWYYSSTTTTTTIYDARQSSDAQTQPSVEEVGEKRTEQVADDDANAVEPEVESKDGHMKDDEQQLQHRPQPQLDEPVLNTITSSIISNTSGWASFFSSNKLLVKNLGYRTSSSGAIEDIKRDENGMEVMDLDFDDEEPSTGGHSTERGRNDAQNDVGSVSSSSSAAAPTSSGNGTSTPIVSTLVKAIPQLMISADAKRESAAVGNGNGNVHSTAKSGATMSSASSIKSTTTTKKGGGSGSGANTPAPAPASPTASASSKNATSKHKKNSSSMGSMSDKTNDTTVSAMTSITTTTTTTKAAASNIKRTASPTPSKKSLSGTSPPPPNVVLPSWQDTFYTAPRNYLPPKPERYADDQGIGGTRGSSGSGSGGVGGKLFGKTMKFVSGVLFNAKEDPGPPSLPAIGASASDSTSTNAGRTGGGKGKERMREMSASTLGRDDSTSGTTTLSLLQREREERFKEFGKELPKAWMVLEDAGWDTSYSREEHDSTAKRLLRRMSSAVAQHPGVDHNLRSKPGVQPPSEAVSDVLRGCKRVVVIGVHGWFPGAMIRTVLGEPTGTSTKFANMMEQALEEFVEEHGVSLEKITKIPLEGDGTIEKRVERLYSNLLANEDWVSDLHEADAIIVATHSQGSVVSTHLLDKLITENHIVTSRNQVLPMGMGAESFPASIGLGDSARRKVQRVCCLALCGIHLGPLRYLSSSTLVGPYLQYFESTAARELFEFQNTESSVSKAYVKALENVLDHGTKMVYIASLNDQVVPIYSGLFTAVSHPLILRALYIDGDAYHSSDFLSNLLVLLLRILNSGVSDSGLLAHLSEATAGSLNGVGHSTAYEELSTFSMAVKYLFLTNDGMAEGAKMTVEPFNATHEQNDYEIPWSLRDVIADERVAHFFGAEISALRDAFREWHPKTSILRDLKRKLQPITRLPSTFSTGSVGASKL